jgi:chemotaxis response regulator CheB
MGESLMPTSPREARQPAPTNPAKRYIAIGASGGDGLEDICALLNALPHPVAAIVMVVLHRPVDQISHLRDVLAESTPATVVVAREGEVLEPGRVYIGEPADHLTLVAGGTAGMVAGGHNEYRNRTVDLLFCSLAANAGTSTIGIVLSGFLDDGSRGLAAIHAAGGVTMVLTPPVAQRGMPHNAINYDAPIDVIGSPDEIAHAVAQLLAADTMPAA